MKLWKQSLTLGKNLCLVMESKRFEYSEFLSELTSLSVNILNDGFPNKVMLPSISFFFLAAPWASSFSLSAALTSSSIKYFFFLIWRKFFKIKIFLVQCQLNNRGYFSWAEFANDDISLPLKLNFFWNFLFNLFKIFFLRCDMLKLIFIQLSELSSN